MKSLVFTIWVTIIVLFNFAFGFAQVPRTISVQGVLSGTLFKSEQIHVIKTSLYAIGAENASLYSQTDTLNIDRDGLFTIQLGKDKGLPSTLPFDKQYVVEFTVNGTVMPMRMPLQSVPYAITSEKVSDNSVELRHLSEGLKQQLQIQEDSKSGKGESTLANYVGGFRSVIAGGDENRTSANFSSILGGYANNVSGTYGTVAGGQSNSVSGNWSFVGGGQNNRAFGSWSSVTAGRDNTIASSATYATIGGGITNQVGASNGTISGGSSNIVTAQGGTVSGGQSNRAMQTFATVSGGQNNIASGQGSVTVGGMNNKSTSQYSIVSGGSNNEANGNHAIVSGGMNNNANAEFSSIAGGSENIIASNAKSSFISGGSNNKINSGMNSGIMGSNNTITSSNNSFTMGTANSISNASNAMAIGTGNIANGNNEFVVGSFASSSSNPANTSNTAFTGNKRFSVGIGSSSGQRKNAFTVFENGSTLIQGKVMTTDTAFLQNATIAQDLKIAGKIDVQQQLTVADDFTLGSENQAGTIKLIDQSGNWYTGFTTGTQSQDILYRLPTSPPIGGQVLASSAVNPLNLEWTNPGSISETDPQVGTIASSRIPRWNGTALVTGSLSDDGTNVITSGTITASNLSGTNTGDITIGTASGLSLTGQALSLATATTTDAGAMSSSDKTKLNSIATGAEVNVNADWNAVSGDAEILNKPTLGTMSAETASDYYTKTQTDAGFQVKDADLSTVATIGTSDQLLKVKNDGSGLEWFTPSYISSYTETDPQVGTIASSGIPRWNGTALVTGSLSDDGTNVSTSGTFTSSNLSGTNTGDITIGTASGLSLTGQALSLATATTTAAGAMSASDKTKLNSIATGAEVNVNADWNAVTGDAEILNKPTLGTMSAETASDYYTKTQTDAGFQVKDADLTTVATIGTSDQLLKVKNDGSGLEWFTPTYISSYTETDPQVGTIATSGVPRWNGTALVTGSLSDDGTNLTTSGTITASNLSGTNTGDITIGTASGLSLSGQALSLATATTTTAGAMSASDKTKLNSIATGAEVNVNADWNAVTGDAEILNKPTLGTMSAETASDYYTKTQTDAGFQVKDADLTTVATIGTNDQLLKVKNDGSGLEWFTPTYISSYTETDPQVGTIATSGVPRWNGTALVTGSLSDDGTNVSTSGTITASNLSGTNTGDITIGTASGLSLTGQALSLATATTTAAGAMSASDKTKLDGIATGAEVNVNADWNAVTGDAEILNKPTLGTMSAETASDYYTKSQTDAGFQVKDADLSTVATIGTSDQLLKVKNDGSGLEWFTPSYISSYTETDPQVGTIATSGVPRWNGTALVTGSLSDDGTNLTTSGTITASNLSGTNTGDITIGTASGLSLTGQALSLATATTTAAGAMSSSDKTKLDGIATGAEVNVNADWNAVSGDAEILNKPTLGTMSAETASDYYTKTQTDAGFQVQDADLTTVATIGTSDQLLKVKNDGSGLEWFTPSYISSYTETDPQVGTIASSGVPRWNGTALVTGSLSDDGTNVSTSGTFTSSNLSGTNTGDITIGTASGLSLTGQALSLATATTTAAGAMSASDKTKLNSIATGAEVNVNADWNAVTGDAEILNKPTLGTMSAETASDYYTKSQTDAGFQVQDADLTTVATIGTSDQLIRVKNDGSGLEWFSPSYISSYTETDPQVGTIATSGIPRWNGTALVTGSLTDDGTNVSTSGTFTSSNLSGTNTGDITIGTASGLSLTGQALSLAVATTTATGAMSASDKTKLNSIASGAEVNVNADWNAVSGDAEILNKPTLGTMSAETASDYYTKTQTDAGFQVKDADLSTVATIGTSDQLLKVKNDGSGLEWFTPTYISSYTETDPQVGTIATSGVPRWNGTALVTGSLTDDGTNVSTSGTFTSSNLSGTNTGDITIGTASGLSLSGQALSLATATTTDAGAMSASDKVKLNSIATGAEVNVNADWNAVTGDAEILNKPTLGTMSAETASDYYTKSQTDAGFQVKDADLTTVATIGTNNQLLKVKNDGSGLEWFTPTYISSYTETDPQVGTIASSGVPRWNGTALVTGSLSDDGTNLTTSGTITASNLSGTNTGDITIGTASGLSLTGQALSLDTATILAHGAMSLNDKIKLNSLPAQNTSGAFLPTKVTAEERNALTNLEAGLIVFCTNCGLQGELQYYSGTQWATFTGDPVASVNGFSKTQIGTDINAISQGDYVGQTYSIDLNYDGSVLAVGYPSNGAFNNNGLVKIFKWNGTIWSQLGGNLVGEAAYDGFGSSVNLSDDGRTLAVGSPYNDGGGSNAGSVRIYNWNGSTWVKDGNDLDGNSSNLNAGTQVILSGNGKTLGVLSSTGIYRFYRKSSNVWSQISNDIGQGKYISFAYDGNSVSTSDASKVEVFYYNGTNWTKKGISLDPNVEAFGTVTMNHDGNIVAIGRFFNDDNGTDAGLVRVLSWNGFAWIQIGSNLLGEATGDRFGYSLSISSDGKKLIVGATHNDGNGVDSGHARVFQWNDENWVQLSTDIDGEAAGDLSGSSVVISGDGSRVAVGAPENDGGALNAGHVRVFK